MYHYGENENGEIVIKFNSKVIVEISGVEDINNFWHNVAVGKQLYDLHSEQREEYMQNMLASYEL